MKETFDLQIKDNLIKLIFMRLFKVIYILQQENLSFKSHLWATMTEHFLFRPQWFSSALALSCSEPSRLIGEQKQEK